MQVARTTLRTDAVPSRTTASLMVVISWSGAQYAELASRSMRAASTWSRDVTRASCVTLTSGSSARIMISDALAGSVSVPVGLVFVQSPESTQAPHVGYFCASLGFATVLLGTDHLRPPDIPSFPTHAGILCGRPILCFVPRHEILILTN